MPSHIEACGIVIEVVPHVSHLSPAPALEAPSLYLGDEAGPMKRIGAQGAMTSLYFRDPDGNRFEVSKYDR